MSITTSYRHSLLHYTLWVSRLSLQVDRDLLDSAGEFEWRLVGEVHGRADVLADIEPFADRHLNRNCSRQLAFGNLVAIDRHSHGRCLAEFARAAAVGNIHLELHLASRERS